MTAALTPSDSFRPADTPISDATSGVKTTQTVVCCVEYGPLEAQTVRLAESIRRFGGAFSSSPVIAVTPRRGPALETATLDAFRRLGVDYVRDRSVGRCHWHGFMNKTACLVHADRIADTDFITWMDSDVLVKRDPEELVNLDAVDFAACAPERGIGGTTGRADDRSEPYWTSLCDTLDMTVDELPWVRTFAEDQLRRFYLNSGVFTFRRETGFAGRYLATCEKLLTQAKRHPVHGVHFTDQVALGLAVLCEGLRWRLLEHAYNFGVGADLDAVFDTKGFADARLVHYHDALTEKRFHTFVQRLAADRPEVADWLAGLGPIAGSAPRQRSAAAQTLKLTRAIRRRLHAARRPVAS
ncbi:MAG: hypothetical protein AAF333_00600 [Planctomycetota bacterium]